MVYESDMYMANVFNLKEERCRCIRERLVKTILDVDRLFDFEYVLSEIRKECESENERKYAMFLLGYEFGRIFAKFGDVNEES